MKNFGLLVLYSVAQLYFTVMTYPKPLKNSVLVLVKTSLVLLKFALANVKAFPLSPFCQIREL